MSLTLPPLPFARDALEPHLSAETIDYHYGKHHQAYLDKLNELIAGTEFADQPLENIIRSSSGGIFNNAAQVWNHSFYWQCLAVPGGASPGEPEGELAAALDAAFGSVGEFREHFTTAALATFGSGWVWLVKAADGKLAVRSTANAANPLTTSEKPLLACDVWEHAYYIDYRDDRRAYLDAFWHLVNWRFAGERLAGG